MKKKKIQDIIITCVILVVCFSFLRSAPSSESLPVSEAAEIALSNLIGETYGESSPPVLMVTSWCGTCRYLEESLAQKDIKFLRYDIEKNEKARTLYTTVMGSGGGPVPVTIAGGKVIVGADVSAIIEARSSQES